MLVLIAAAMPVRVAHSLPVINSFSVLDILLVAVAATLFLDLAFGAVDTGPRDLFRLLCVPLVISVLSLVWSHDRAATVRAVIVYAEGLIIYVFVLRELSGLGPDRIVSYIKRYAYLLIIPAVLLVLHVPGFQPEVPYKHSSGAYLTYFTRLSHPVLGGSNNLASILAFFAPILLYWGHARSDRRATNAGFVTLLAIFLTLSRGILLSFVLAGLVYALTLGRQKARSDSGLRARVFAAAAVATIGIGVFYSVNPATHQFFAGRFSLTNVQSRFELVSLSFTKIGASPFLGYGSGVEPPLAPTGAEVVDGKLHLPNSYIQGTPKLDSHNAYLQQALYFGLPLGLLVSLALWGTVGFFLSRRRTAALAGVIAYTLLVQLVSFLFEASYEGTVLRVLFYLSVGLAVALLRSTDDERSRSLGALA